METVGRQDPGLFCLEQLLFHWFCTHRDLRVLSSVLSLPDSVWKPLRQVCATALQTGKLGLKEIRPHGWEKVRHGCATPNSVPLAVEKPSCLRGWNWAVCCEGRRFFLSWMWPERALKELQLCDPSLPGDEGSHGAGTDRA